MMSVMHNTVLLLKSQKTDEITDKYEQLLTKNGYGVHQIKTLIFDYKNLPILAEKLNKPDDYSGIILSSPRCVKAIQLALENRGLDTGWWSKENFVVGEATFAAARESLGVVCKGAGTGNANNLAELIISDFKGDFVKPFLFPHGNLKTGVLHERLKEVGLSMDETLVYDTISNPNIENQFSNITNNFNVLPEFIVFFSPSGIESSLELIKKVPVDWPLIKFIAIGPVTEEKMNEKGIPVSGVAQKPNPDSVLQVITGFN